MIVPESQKLELDHETMIRELKKLSPKDRYTKQFKIMAKLFHKVENDGQRAVIFFYYVKDTGAWRTVGNIQAFYKTSEKFD